MEITNTLTVDLEDYFQVAALAEAIDVSSWEKMPSRVEANTYRLLDLFDRHSVKATYFILGWIAQRYPKLVKDIVSRGHEVASHGYSHQPIYNQPLDLFRQETERAKKILEDITGTAVYGYRAASYSITNRSLWALDVLADLGFKFDSSIFPIYHDLYGIPGFAEEPHILTTPQGQKLIEYPISTYKILAQTLPIGGGGYFRLYPYWLSRYFCRKTNARNKPFVFYVHPWEIDPDQPKQKVSWISRFRHYNNLNKCYKRLSQLLSEFKFIPMGQALREQGLLEVKKDGDLEKQNYANQNS